MKLTVSFRDLLKYGDLVAEVIFLFKQLEKSPVGNSVVVPRVVFDVGDEQWEIAATTAKRLK